MRIREWEDNGSKLNPSLLGLRLFIQGHISGKLKDFGKKRFKSLNICLKILSGLWYWRAAWGAILFTQTQSKHDTTNWTTKPNFDQSSSPRISLSNLTSFQPFFNKFDLNIKIRNLFYRIETREWLWKLTVCILSYGDDFEFGNLLLSFTQI